eukprot:TRINITY_DN4637_c0_g1_i1.p1 TRINITY_DN4637_c0_g1~~TRINITY_DN4637_c0_g1_i1.p1  ORF type:complete len:1734 (-),score=375.84 TRINITY_DN4637_c0_g1_i1:24-5225(-)
MGDSGKGEKEPANDIKSPKGERLGVSSGGGGSSVNGVSPKSSKWGILRSPLPKRTRGETIDTTLHLINASNGVVRGGNGGSEVRASHSVGHKKGKKQSSQSKKSMFRDASLANFSPRREVGGGSKSGSMINLPSASASDEFDVSGVGAAPRSADNPRKGKSKKGADEVVRGTGLTVLRSDGGALLDALKRLKEEEGITSSSSEDESDDTDEEEEEEEEEEDYNSSRLKQWDPAEEARKAREQLMKVRGERESRQGSVADRLPSDRASVAPGSTSASQPRVVFGSPKTDTRTSKGPGVGSPTSDTENLLRNAVRELEGLDVSNVKFELYSNDTNTTGGDRKRSDKSKTDSGERNKKRNKKKAKKKEDRSTTQDKSSHPIARSATVAAITTNHTTNSNGNRPPALPLKKKEAAKDLLPESTKGELRSPKRIKKAASASPKKDADQKVPLLSPRSTAPANTTSTDQITTSGSDTKTTASASKKSTTTTATATTTTTPTITDDTDQSALSADDAASSEKTRKKRDKKKRPSKEISVVPPVQLAITPADDHESYDSSSTTAAGSSGGSVRGKEKKKPKRQRVLSTDGMAIVSSIEDESLSDQSDTTNLTPRGKIDSTNTNTSEDELSASSKHHKHSKKSKKKKGRSKRETREISTEDVTLTVPTPRSKDMTGMEEDEETSENPTTPKSSPPVSTDTTLTSQPDAEESSTTVLSTTTDTPRLSDQAEYTSNNSDSSLPHSHSSRSLRYSGDISLQADAVPPSTSPDDPPRAQDVPAILVPKIEEEPVVSDSGSSSSRSGSNTSSQSSAPTGPSKKNREHVPPVFTMVPLKKSSTATSTSASSLHSASTMSTLDEAGGTPLVQPPSQNGSYSSNESSLVVNTKPMPKEDTVSPRNDIIRTKIREEFIETERTYVDGLLLITNAYMQPIKMRELLRPRDYNALFRDIPSLVTIHTTLLTDLEAAELQENKHAAFIRALQYLTPFFKMYFPYVNQYDSANERLSELLLKGGKFAAYVKEVQNRPESKSLDLASYMLTPIQRLPRYELLLKEYLKNTTDEKEQETIRILLHSVQQVNTFVNDSKHESIQRKQLYILQKIVKNRLDLFGKTGRHVVKEGVLQLSEIIDRDAKVDQPNEGALRVFLLKRPGHRMSNNFKEFHIYLLDDLMIVMSGESKRDTVKHKYVMHFFLNSVAVESVSSIPSIPAADGSAVFMLTTLSRISERRGTEEGGEEEVGNGSTGGGGGSRDSHRLYMRRFCIKAKDAAERNEWKEEIAKRAAGNLDQMLDQRKNARRSGLFVRPTLSGPEELQPPFQPTARTGLTTGRKPDPADARERTKKGGELLKKFSQGQPALVAYVLNERKVNEKLEPSGSNIDYPEISEADLKIRIDELEVLKREQAQRVADALKELEKIDHELNAQRERLRVAQQNSNNTSNNSNGNSRSGSRLEDYAATSQAEIRRGSVIEERVGRRGSSNSGIKSTEGSSVVIPDTSAGSGVNTAGPSPSSSSPATTTTPPATTTPTNTAEPSKGEGERDEDGEKMFVVADDYQVRICVACNAEIEDTAVKVGNKRYHPEHFVCTLCKCQLGGKDYFPVGPEEEPFCVECYADRRKLRCAACKAIITGTYMQILNRNWHTRCMTCSLCSTFFYSPEGHKLNSIMGKDGQLVCKPCLALTYNKDRICAVCALPATDIGDTDVLSPVTDRCWHEECFKCKTCGVLLNKDSPIEWRDAFPHCPSHSVTATT